jgi:hypothetical protein
MTTFKILSQFAVEGRRTLPLQFSRVSEPKAIAPSDG